MNDIGIVGGGPWAETVAHLVRHGQKSVVLWPGPDNNGSEEGRASLERLKQELGVTLADSPAQIGERARLIFVALPSWRLRSVCRQLGDHLRGYHRLVHTLHGLEPETGVRPSEMLREETPARQVGALVGPIRLGAELEFKPGAAVVASRFPEVITDVQEALANPIFRVYGNRDVVGVEVGGAVAGVLSVVVGMLDEMDLGPSTRGTVFARGVAEMSRIGCMYGAQERTFSGMSGLGALVAETSGKGGIPYQIGKALASGVSMNRIMETWGEPARELVETCQSLTMRNRKEDIEAHITDAVHRILCQDCSVGEAARSLLSLQQMME